MSLWKPVFSFYTSFSDKPSAQYMDKFEEKQIIYTS